MPDRAKNKAAPEQRAPLEERLDSWKEVAAYLGRGVRTVQRWEREIVRVFAAGDPDVDTSEGTFDSIRSKKQ